VKDFDLLLRAIDDDDLIQIDWLLTKGDIKIDYLSSEIVFKKAIDKNNLPIIQMLLGYGFAPSKYSETMQPERKDSVEIAYLNGYDNIIAEFKQYAIDRAFSDDVENFPVGIPDEIYRAFEIKEKQNGNMYPDLRTFLINSVITFLNN